MRYVLFLLLVCSTGFAAAQQNLPPRLEPLPEVPGENDAALEPQITIIKRGSEKVEEYRIKGRLYMVKITPSHGKPYYLIDHKGDGQFSRQDHLDSGVRVPQWVLFQF